MNKSILLLKTLLLSTSQINIIKHSMDKKKRKRAIGGIVGVAFLYLFIIVFALATCIGYGYVGIIQAAPVMTA